MLKGKIQFGTNAQTHTHWDQDALDDCSPDNQIWGWSIRSSEILHHDRAKINDDVLRTMLYMGLLDKKAGAPAWTEQTSLKQGIRLVLNMVVRVLQRCFKMDAKASRTGCRSNFVEVDQFGFNRLMTSSPNTPAYSTSKPRPSRRWTRISLIWDFVRR